MYGLPVVLAVLAGGVLYLMGDAPGLILLKLTFVPFYLLSGRAIDILLPVPGGLSLSLKFLERQLIDAFLVACFMTVFLWNPDKSATEILVGFLVFISGYVSLTSLSRLVFSKMKAPNNS